jgi:uncharacterized protein (DUF2267 family)
LSETIKNTKTVMNKAIDLRNQVREDYTWINEVAEKVGAPGNPEAGIKVLKGVLHVIRDMLNMEEVFTLSKHLPLMIRGIYFDGYNPYEGPVMMYNRELLNRFRKRMGPRNGDYFEDYLRRNEEDLINNEEFLNRIRENIDLDETIEPEDAFLAVIEVIQKNNSSTKLENFKYKIPRHVHHLMA